MERLSTPIELSRPIDRSNVDAPPKVMERGPVERPSLLATKRADRLALIVLAGMCFTFTLPLIFGYFPMQEGWFQHFGHLMHHGEVPYRDFFFPLPPFTLLQYYIITSFGNVYVVARVYGLMELMALSSIVYLILRRAFPPFSAFLGAASGLGIYLTNTNDTITSYYQTSLFFTLFGVLLLLLGRDTGSNRRCQRWFVASGICFGLAVLTKQTAILPVVATYVAAWLVDRRAGKNLPYSWIGMAFLGTVAALVAYLITNGTLATFGREVLAGGSKGSLGSLLFGFLKLMLTRPIIESTLALMVAIGLPLMATLPIVRRIRLRVIVTVSIIAVTAFLFVVAAASALTNIHVNAGVVIVASAVAALYTRGVGAARRRMPWAKRGVTSTRHYRYAGGSVVAACGLACIGALVASIEAPVVVQRYAVASRFWALHEFLVPLGFCGALVMFGVLAIVHWRPGSNGLTAKWLVRGILIVEAIAWMWSHGLSGVLEVHGMLMAVAWLCALASTAMLKMWRLVGVVLGSVGVALFLMFALDVRLYVPYSWWGWGIAPSEQPFNVHSRASIKVSQLTAFDVPQRDARIFDSVVRVIGQNANRGTEIYVYPFMPVFYDLTGTYSPAMCQVTWMTVCPDKYAASDPAMLMRTRPKVIVDLMVPDYAYDDEESLFRGGKKSEQRTIAATIAKLVEGGGYRPIYRTKTPGYTWTLVVYARGA